MAQAALFTSPMARKKPVDARYNPNSYRVISHEAEDWQRPKAVSTYTTTSNSNVIGQVPDATLPPRWDHRKNRPNATSVGFLSQDVKLLNEPVCDVYTATTKKEQNAWWPHRVSDDPHKEPKHTLDTTVRHDFQYRGKEVSKSSRHASNPHKKPAWGSVPVNFLRDKDGKQRFYKEGISYEHQYNCRLDPQYPIRAKRHGAFVWDQFPATEVDRMLHHYGIVADRSQQTSAKPNSKNPNATKTQPNGGDACTPAAPKASSKRASPVATAAQPNSKETTKDCTATVTSTGKSDNLVNTVQGGGGASVAGEAVQLPPIYA